MRCGHYNSDGRNRESTVILVGSMPIGYNGRMRAAFVLLKLTV